jgi:hypothetical protein
MKNRKLNRLPVYNYSNAGNYFITCNTQNRVNHFGVIKNDEMILNINGKIVIEQWHWLLVQYPYLVGPHKVYNSNGNTHFVQ